MGNRCRIVTGFPAMTPQLLQQRCASARRRSHLGGLVWTLVRTDFVTRYHGTIGGFVWALLKPLTMFLVLMGVFSFVFSNTPQYRIGLILGLFLYEFFQEGTRTGLESLQGERVSADQGEVSVLGHRRDVDLQCGDHAGALFCRSDYVPGRSPGGRRASLPWRCTSGICSTSSRSSPASRSPRACCSCSIATSIRSGRS